MSYVRYQRLVLIWSFYRIDLFASTETIVGDWSDCKWSGVLIWSFRSPGMREDLRKTIIFAQNLTQCQPSIKGQNSWPPIFSVIAVLRRRRERKARRIEHGRSKRSWSPQSSQTLAIVCAMFSYNRPNRKKTFWVTEAIKTIRAIYNYMRTSL